jgi:uncharacterized protein YbcI
VDEDPMLGREERPDGASGGQRSVRSVELSAISNAVVRLYSEYYGRGPTRAKTYWQDDLIVCILADTFTTVERTLIDVGRTDQVQQTRLVFQQAMEERFKRAIEEITGRHVAAFLSQTSVEPDVAVEVFVLEPETGTS